MFKINNKKQVLAFLSGGGVAIFLLIPILYSIPVWAKFVIAVVAGYVIYLTLRLAWIMAEPADASALLKPRASSAQANGLCPVCGKNRQGHQTLKVGYRKATASSMHFSVVDTVLVGEGLTDDIQLSLSICERCARRYVFLSKLGFLAPLGLDRSFRVLRRKQGYLRGLQHPFDASNIQAAA